MTTPAAASGPPSEEFRHIDFMVSAWKGVTVDGTTYQQNQRINGRWLHMQWKKPRLIHQHLYMSTMTPIPNSTPGGTDSPVISEESYLDWLAGNPSTEAIYGTSDPEAGNISEAQEGNDRNINPPIGQDEAGNPGEGVEDLNTFVAGHSVQEIMVYAGKNPELMEAILAAEQAQGEPRKTLIKWLQG